jgi:hypothetical protein
VSTRFAFRFDPRYARVLGAAGVTRERAEVRVDDETFAVDFGPWKLRTPRSNVASATVTGPYVALRVIGPHLSLKDRGVSFGTTTEAGTCVLFREPVRALDPLGLLRHPGCTVTVEDVEGLAALLSA